MMGTREEIEEFTRWHDARMHELNYPLEIRAELTRARSLFWVRQARRQGHRPLSKPTMADPK